MSEENVEVKTWDDIPELTEEQERLAGPGEEEVDEAFGHIQHLIEWCHEIDEISAEDQEDLISKNESLRKRFKSLGRRIFGEG